MPAWVVVWFVFSVLVEVLFSLALYLWLRQQTSTVFSRVGIPGYLEYKYWKLNAPRRRWVRTVIALRVGSMLNVVASAIVAIPWLAG
jgi:hypothetical protein